MGFAYTVKNQEGMYFVTCTISQWIDVFTRSIYIDIVISSLDYCQKAKGLKIYAWVVMSNHIHLIVKSEKEPLSDIIRDFKKFTSTQIYKAIETNPKESRKRWLLWLFKTDKGIKVWEEGYHGEEIITQEFYKTKVNYIHQNPVRARIVEKEEEYFYSSAGEYYGIRKSLLKLDI
ncbi:MAG: hypothetical protein RLZZ175_1230 [Bacteroidota bacterium]|jgi:putative transposase